MVAKGRIQFGLDTSQISGALTKVKNEAGDMADSVGGGLEGAFTKGSMAVTAMGAALGSALAIARELVEVQDRAANRLSEFASARAAVLSLYDSPAGQQQGDAYIRQLRASGMEAGQAAETVFNVVSQQAEGVLPELVMLSQMTSGRDVQPMARGLGRVLALTPERETPAQQRRIMDLLFQSSQTTEAEAPVVAEAVARAMPATMGTQVGLEDLMSIFAGAGGLPPAEMATGLQALFSAMRRNRMGNVPLGDAIRGLEQRFPDPVELEKALGGTQGVRAFGIIQSQLSSIEAARAGQGGVTIAGRFESVMSDPLQRALQERASAERIADIAEEERGGLQGLERQTRMERARAGGLLSRAQQWARIQMEDYLPFTTSVLDAVTEPIFGESPYAATGMERAVARGVAKGSAMRPTTVQDNAQGGPNSGIDTSGGQP